MNDNLNIDLNDNGETRDASEAVTSNANKTDGSGVQTTAATEATATAPCEVGADMPKYKVLDSNAIKLIAIIAMTIDHICWAVAPGYSTEWWAILMHIVGRLTKPIMWYCIAEGYHYTRNVKKYTARLFVFALISHVPYMMQSIAFKQYGWLSLVPFATGEGVMGHLLNQTSVMLSLAVGLVMLRVNDSKKLPEWAKVLAVLGLCVVAFPADGSCVGSLCVLSIGSNRGKPLKQLLWCLLYVVMYAAVYFFCLNKVYGLIQLCEVLAVPVIMMYNGKRGSNPKVNKVLKWGFYVYYPLHLLVISVILLLCGAVVGI